MDSLTNWLVGNNWLMCGVIILLVIVSGCIVSFTTYFFGDVGFLRQGKSFKLSEAVYTTEKFGSGPLKKAERTHNFCRNSSVSLQKLWVRSAFLRGPDPNFSVL